MSNDDTIYVSRAAVATVQAATGATATVRLSGIPGEPGPIGPIGPPGPATAAAYTHVQAVPAAVWTITHPLAFQPNVTVIDSSNEQVEGDVIFGPLGTISLVFSGAFSGTAYLS